MKKKRTKFLKFTINLFFAIIWFVFSIYLWEYVYVWLELKNNYYEYFWLAGYYFFIPLPIPLLLIFVIPYYFFSQYIWNK